jgi:hypothetical protein
MADNSEANKENPFIDETAKAHKSKSMKKKPGDGRPKAKWDPSNDATLIDVLVHSYLLVKPCPMPS